MIRTKVIAVSVVAAITISGLTGCGDGYESDYPLIGSPGSSQEAEQPVETPIEDSLFRFGETAELENGVKLKVAAPRHTTVTVPYGTNDPVSFRVTMTNGSSRLVDPQEVMVAVSSGGEAAEESFEAFAPSTQLLPGKSISWETKWFVKDPKDVQLELYQPIGDGIIIFTS